jgi:hypothetical protein
MGSRRAAGGVVSLSALVLMLFIFGFPLCLRPAITPDLDSVGALWIVESGGIVKVAASDGSVLLRITNIEKICSVAVDEKNGRLWALGKRELLAFGFDGLRLFSVPFGKGNQCQGNRHRSMAADPVDGGLWVGAQKTLYRFNARGERLITLPLPHQIEGMVLDTVQWRL